ncbi:MAG: hypothetical protein IPP69_02130 [Flavobacteriales bacterium]|nr:hypothetical protein [Flavobacteriales bacterium]
MKALNTSVLTLEEDHRRYLLTELFVDVYGELCLLNKEVYDNMLNVEELTKQINLERIKKCF